MNTLKTTPPVLHAALLLAATVSIGVDGNRASGDDPTPKKPSAPLTLSDLNLDHDGKEITVIFKVTNTQLIGGTRDGKFPHILLHHSRMRVRPTITVRVHGKLADAFHRFALVAPDEQFVGRTIKASGKLTISKDFPKDVDQSPIYKLILRDVDKFQIVRDEGYQCGARNRASPRISESMPFVTVP